MLLLIDRAVSIPGGDDEDTTDDFKSEIADRIESMLSAALYSMDGC